MKKQTLEEIEPRTASIRMSREEIRSFGKFDNLTDAQVDTVADFLALAAIITYDAAVKEKRESKQGKLE